MSQYQTTCVYVATLVTSHSTLITVSNECERCEFSQYWLTTLFTVWMCLSVISQIAFGRL